MSSTFPRKLGRPSLRSEDVREPACAPEDRDDLDPLFLHAVNHAESADDDFAHAGCGAFWDNPARLGEVGQSLDHGDDAPDQQVSVVWGILGDVGTNRLDVA